MVPIFLLAGNWKNEQAAEVIENWLKIKLGDGATHIWKKASNNIRER
jgi:hypothetical protein